MQTSGSIAPRRILYLDQNAWIALARGAWDKSRFPREYTALSTVIDAVRAERLRIPLSFTTLYETIKINDPERRTHLAYVQATLSGGIVIRGRRRIIQENFLQLFSESLSLKRPKPANDWFLSDVFIEVAAEYADHSFGPDVTPGLIERIRAEPDAALFSYLASLDEDIRREAVRQFSSASAELIARIESRREAAAGASFALRRRAYSARLLLDELDCVFTLAHSLGLDWTCVRDIGPTLAKSLISDVPIMNVERELAVRLEDQNRPIAENDLRDVASFAAALPLSDVFVGEKPLVNVARQARLSEKYGTLLLTSVRDLTSADL